MARQSLHRWMPLLVVLAGACTRDRGPTAAPLPTPDAPRILGLYEITITGIGTDQMSATARPARSPGGPSASLATVTSGLVLEAVATGSFSDGTRTGAGQRYLTSTFRVRNATGGPLTNVTFVMAGTAATLPGTAISQLRKFDGSSADPAIASATIPTGAATLSSDLATLRAPYADVLQIFTEAEVAAISPPAGVTNMFPYGFVVRSRDTEANRTLPSAAANANKYDGLLTVAFRVPLQPAAASDVFTLSFQAVAVVDTETRMTESMEEAQDSAAVRRLRERAASLGATTVTVLAGSSVLDPSVADYPGQRQICQPRTAGTAGTPTNFITQPAGYARLDILRPGESSSVCGAYFRSGTATAPTLNTPYSVTLKAMDRYGNVTAGAVDTVSLSQASGPAATFGAAAALVSGQATSSVTYQANGSSVLTANGARKRTQRVIEVATAATVVINSGDNQAAMAGAAVPTAPSVLVRDLGGTPLAGVPVTFSVASGGGYVTGGVATTNGSGVATVGSWVLGSPATANTLTATAAGAATPATFRGSGCSGGGGTGYGITLCYLTTMTATQRAAFDSAAARWGRVITGDLADVPVSLGSGSCGSSPSFNLSIDDLLIFAAVEPIDGPGAILGSANNCFVRSTGGLPLIGTMRFDSADMESMESDGTLLRNVILHEMGHVIGIGTRWGAFGLLQSASPVGGPPLDTYFSGSNGITGFNNIGGSTYTGGNKVPVENTGGAGTINAHWRESVLATELMTGYANYGSMPLSQLTVRSLADLGYSVNVAAADPFFLTLSISAQGSPPGTIPLGNDILDIPGYSMDARGRVVAMFRRAGMIPVP